MVVLNFYGIIEPICISNKLKLYISNLPEEENNNWQSSLVEELIMSERMIDLSCESMKKEKKNSIYNLYTRAFPNKPTTEDIELMAKELSENMIHIYFNYDYSDMPLGDWKTNCFDSRFCEEDYVRKIIHFMHFLSVGSYDNCIFPKPIPIEIYSSDCDWPNPFDMFRCDNHSSAYIQSLKEWGQLFDNMLLDKNDYLLFDYLLSAVHEYSNHSEYRFLKLYSLCQLFLEKEKESELDYKLPEFIDFPDSNKREQAAMYYRVFRNKIAHGDFVALDGKIEDYASSIMDGQFWFDYTEYSRRNWVLMHVCCELEEVVRKLIYLLLFDREKLNQKKNSKNIN